MMSTWETWLAGLPGWMIYLLIFVTTAIIYQTTFARSLPLLKNILIYLFLSVGCFLLFIMQLMGFPIIPALAITVLLILVTHLRLYVTRKKENAQEAPSESQ